MDESKQVIFVEGMNIKEPSPNAPQFILLEIGIKPHTLFQWARQYQDEKGWLNITVKRSKKNTIYAELNTWKPQITQEQKNNAKEYHNRYQTIVDETEDEKFDKEFDRLVDEKDSDQQYKESVNQKTADIIFPGSKPLSEEELADLDSIPF